MANPRVSVCIPVYNLELYIAEALDSLKAQTFQDYEAIIVNDGSVDRSEEIIAPYLEDPRFRYIRQENGGVARARETATLAARGEWFAHLDGDDIWVPNKLERQLALADEDKRTNFLYSNLIQFTETGQESVPYTKPMPEGDITAYLYRDNFVGTSTVMIKTADIAAVGGYPIRPYGEDYLMWLRIARNGIWARMCMEPLVRYRLRGQSQVSDRLLNLNKQIGIMSDALEREDRPQYVRILNAGLANVKRNIAYEMARKASRGEEGDIEQLLWQSWNCSKPGLKRLAMATVYSISRITGIKAGRNVVMRTLQKLTDREALADQ